MTKEKAQEIIDFLQAWINDEEVECINQEYDECVIDIEDWGFIQLENTYKTKNPPLKEGDLVEVLLNDKWVKRIFLSHLKNGSIICVSRNYEKEYKNGKRIYAYSISKNEWRRIQNKKYRPFTENDNWKEYFWKKVIVDKSNKDIRITIIDFDITTPNHIILYGSYLTAYSFEYLFDNYENLDGSPLGILIEGDKE